MPKGEKKAKFSMFRNMFRPVAGHAVAVANAHLFSGGNLDSGGQHGHASPSESQDALREDPQVPAGIQAQENDGNKAHWKQEICDNAKTAWHGLQKLVAIIEPMVPEPFNSPLELFNTISEVAAKYIDNEEMLKGAMKQLSDSLVDANNLAELIVDEAVKMHKIQSLHPVKKTLEQDNISSQITACLSHLNQGAARYLREMMTAIARTVYQNSQALILQRVMTATHSVFAPRARFNADTASAGPARRACTSQTRLALMDTVQHSPIFWLSGMAGSGKSTIAYTLCQHLHQKGRLGASFFCSRNDPWSWSRASIIPTIVRQLMEGRKSFVHALGDVHLDDVISVSAHHVDELLVQPWLQYMVSQSKQPLPLVVVIDALDEIEGSDQGPQLIKQLIEAVSAAETGLYGLKFFLTSRPHPRIVQESGSIKSKYHMEEIHPKEAINDVRLFVNAELGDLSDEQREENCCQVGRAIHLCSNHYRLCLPTQFISQTFPDSAGTTPQETGHTWPWIGVHRQCTRLAHCLPL
ncbi:hypothetical protein C8F01DRAFT_1106563 [Mycena amicta]|nr:hypothetical protein C8F01DRAFT_1106563 [Mycena amicta]